MLLCRITEEPTILIDTKRRRIDNVDMRGQGSPVSGSPVSPPPYSPVSSSKSSRSPEGPHFDPSGLGEQTIAEGKNLNAQIKTMMQDRMARQHQRERDSLASMSSANALSAFNLMFKK